jgi:hypothetical protein
MKMSEMRLCERIKRHRNMGFRKQVPSCSSARNAAWGSFVGRGLKFFTLRFSGCFNSDLTCTNGLCSDVIKPCRSASSHSTTLASYASRFMDTSLNVSNFGSVLYEI